MIIQNGFIRFRVKTAGGIDTATGYPVEPADTSWSDPVPCQWLVKEQDLQAKAGTEYRVKHSYEILIDEQEVRSERIELSVMTGEIVGVFSIRTIEPLEAVCQTRLIV